MKLLVLVTFFQLTLLQTNFSPVASYEQCDGQRYYNICGGGGMCQYVQICLGDMKEYRYCPSLDPSKPYCNRGECSETPDFSMDDCSPRVIYCSGTGIFPGKNLTFLSVELFLIRCIRRSWCVFVVPQLHIAAGAVHRIAVSRGRSLWSGSVDL